MIRPHLFYLFFYDDSEKVYAYQGPVSAATEAELTERIAALQHKNLPYRMNSIDSRYITRTDSILPGPDGYIYRKDFNPFD